MKKLYTIIIAVGILVELALLLLFDKKIAAYGPIFFWIIGLFGVLNYALNILNLSKSVKKTNPELYSRHSFGFTLNRNALSDTEFLSALNDDEQKMLAVIKLSFKYLMLCFVLFVVSAILIVLI